MKRQIDMSETFAADLRDMFEQARVMPRLPEDVRARARDRALAFLTAATATRPSISVRQVRGVRLAFAATLVFVAGTVGAALGTIVTLRSLAARGSVPAPPSLPDGVTRQPPVLMPSLCSPVSGRTSWGPSTFARDEGRAMKRRPGLLPNRRR